MNVEEMMVHDWVFLKIFYLIIFDCSGSSLSCGLSSSFCEQGLLSSCDVQASHFGGFSCCRAQALGMWALVVAPCGFSSCGTWA